MKYNILIFSFLMLIMSSNFAIGDNNYIINEDTVYTDDSKVYLSANPHTLSSSGWVYFNLTSKVYTGNIDACWGFNTSVSKPTKAEIYSPRWINTTTNHQKIFYNPTHVVYTGDNLDYGNSYNTNYKYTITETINNDNGTTYITSNVAFDSYTIDGTNYTIYWHNRHDNHCLWRDFSPSFNSVIHNYNGYNKWYYIKNIPITSNKEYTVRAWIDVPVSTKKQSGKYYFAIKPSHETISQAITNGHFYNLDPWWNATWTHRKEIILTGGTSGAQTDYQVLLNVSFDSDMQPDFDDLRFCNETHELDSWLESKVDDSYALVWVEFPTTPANGVNQTYYMYYGNAGAASDWDGAATFEFFEGWDNLNAWTTRSGSPSVSPGELTINNDALSHDIVFPSLFSVRARIKYSDSTAAGGRFILLGDAWNLAAETGPYIGWTSAADIQAYYGAWHDGGDYVSGVYDIVEMRDVNNTAHTFDLMVNDITGISGACFRNDKTMSMIGLVETDGLANFISDWLLVRKYAANPPTYAFGSEETKSYMPPNPISLMNTTGNFWINHTWSPGSSNVTNSYNVSVNDVWHNTSPAYYNDTYAPHAWQNITVYAFNTSGIGVLSTGSINQNTQIPNNPITITNTSDWSGDAGETVYVDYDATDIDSDTATFSCDRTDLFTDFDTSTGTGNWTATANIYYVDFGVSDGYGSISNYTMTLTESSVEITLLDETKLIMSEITTGLKGVNMSNYLVYAFILIGILLIILGIQIITNNIYRR